MPLVQVKTNVKYSDDQKVAVLRGMTKVMVEQAHKNEEAVMVTLESIDGTMGNLNDPFCMVDIRSMNGINHSQNNDVCKEMTKVTEEVLGVDPERTYMTFIHIPETCWGLLGGICIWDESDRLWKVNGKEVK